MVVDKLVRSNFIYFDLITIFQTYAFLIEVHWLKIRGYMLLNKITKSGGVRKIRVEVDLNKINY